MKNIIYSLIIVFIIISCTENNNKNTEDIIESSHDSLTLEVDPYQKVRDSIFENLGDTIIGGICFGMNNNQYQKAFLKFYNSLPLINRFDKLEPSIGEFIINKQMSYVDSKYYIENPFGYGALFNNNKLYNLVIETQRYYYRDYKKLYNDINNFIIILESKYGKCYIKSLDSWFDMIKDGETSIAEWYYKNRGITLYVIVEPIDQNDTEGGIKFSLAINAIDKDIIKKTKEYTDSALENKAKEEIKIKEMNRKKTLEAI